MLAACPPIRQTPRGMAALRILTKFPRWLMLAVLLCILAARVAVPSGWMPVVDADGGLVLAPCSGMGAMAMGAGPQSDHAMPGHAADHGGHDKGNAEHGDHPCSGAGVSAGLEIPVAAAPLALAIIHAATAPPALAVAVGRGLAAPPPPSTGPPAHV